MTTASLMGADGNLLDCTGIQCLDLHVQECVRSLGEPERDPYMSNGVSSLAVCILISLPSTTDVHFQH